MGREQNRKSKIERDRLHAYVKTKKKIPKNIVYNVRAQNG